MIGLGADHGGYKLKEEIKKYLDEKGLKYIDYGAYDEERTDYPIYAKKVCESIQRKECDEGILVCGTGFGMNICANKFKGIRASSCWNEEVAKLFKEHNNGNVIALPGRFIDVNQSLKILDAWLDSRFMMERHTERLQMIENIENEIMK